MMMGSVENGPECPENEQRHGSKTSSWKPHSVALLNEMTVKTLKSFDEMQLFYDLLPNNPICMRTVASVQLSNRLAEHFWTFFPKFLMTI